MKDSVGSQFPRTRLLTREEMKLWLSATLDVRTRKARASSSSEAKAFSVTHAATTPIFSPSLPSKGFVSTPASSKNPNGVSRTLAPLTPFDKRLKRRLSSRKSRPDDSIDLHGFTQAQAYRVLGEFLRRSVESGARLVLVITGKGSTIGDPDGRLTDCGILRRNVPHWLRSPHFRSIVLSVDEAALPHGGQGAFYVGLRRHRCAR